MYANVFTKSIRDRLGSGLVGALALAATLLFGLWAYQDVDISFYYDLPAAVLQLMGIDPENFGVASMAYGAMYDFMGAFIVGGVAISIGASAIAGEEQVGTFGLLLGNPLSRRQALASKTAGLVSILVVMGLLLWGAAVLSAQVLDVDTGGVHLGAISVALTLNGLLYGMLALAIGSWTGRRGRASGVAAAVMVIGYLGAGLLPLIDQDGLAHIFPWYYYSSSSPLNNGLDWGDAAVLVGLSVLCFVAAWYGIQRRDLRDKGAEATLADRLRANPMTKKMMDRIAGSARVSGVTVKSATEFQGLLTVTAGIMFYMGFFIPILYNFIPEDFVQIFSTFPDAMIAMIGGVDMSTPAGFVTGEIFSLVAPIAIIVLLASMGARALAGEEESHTMGLLLANPISRGEIVFKKTVAMVLLAVVFGIITALGTWLGTLAGGLDISLEGVLATSGLLTLFGLVFGGLSLAASAATGRRKLATWATTGVALVTWFMFSFLTLTESAAVLANLSPFQWYLGSDPLVNGMSWVDAALLGGTFVALVAVSVPLFARRDLRG
ncbi:MAG TPA: ABC transporter permease subunit [Acidimicrobiia bacterium]|nr:ABC transporter permease subunit [Acidimicrobiia bacterium]